MTPEALLQRRARQTVWCLMGLLVAISVHWWVTGGQDLLVLILGGVAAVLGVANVLALRWRIRRGYFGDTRAEIEGYLR